VTICKGKGLCKPWCQECPENESNASIPFPQTTGECDQTKSVSHTGAAVTVTHWIMSEFQGNAPQRS